MTPPDSSRADDRPEWLAGYADGELDEAARRRVEDRLARDPGAADALRDQEQLSPANRELWDAVVPPEPSPAAWGGVADRIAAALPRRTPGRPARRWGARLGGMAAAVVIGWTAYQGLNSPAPPSPAEIQPTTGADDPLAGFAVLPVAGPADVEILAVRGEFPDGFLVGEHPFPDRITLAGPGDVTLAADSDLSAGPGDAPMIFPRGR